MSTVLKNIPTSKLERWKYTNLAPAVKDIPEVIGAFDVVYNDPDNLVEKLGTVLQSPEPWLDRVLKRTPVGSDEYHDMALWDLSNQHLQEGLVVDVPVGKSVETPLEINVAGHDGSFVVPRMVVRLGHSAELTLIEDLTGKGHYWHNGVMQIHVGRGAKLRHIRIQDNSKQAVYTQNTHVEIDRDGSYEALTLTTGSTLSRNQIHIDMMDENANCRLYGINLLSGGQLGDTTIEVAHRAPHCNSEQFYRSVLDDRARGVFQGKVHVYEGADHTDAQQLSNALLLSEGAEMDTKPELEIYDDDVKCSHGATTGQIDDEALFYMRSRGITEGEARGMLIHAFVDEVVDKFGDETVKGVLRKRIEGVL